MRLSMHDVTHSFAEKLREIENIEQRMKDRKKTSSLKRSQDSIHSNKFLRGEPLRFLCFAATDARTNEHSDTSLEVQKCEEHNDYQKWEFPYMEQSDAERVGKISWKYHK